MTQKEFDALPGLLTPRQFREVTGLSRNIVSQLVHDQELTVFVAPAPKSPTKRKKWRVRKHTGRYFKRDAARMAGFVL